MERERSDIPCLYGEPARGIERAVGLARGFFLYHGSKGICSQLLLVGLVWLGFPADGNREVFACHLIVADDDHVRHPVHPGFPDLLAHALVPFIKIAPYALRVEGFADLLCVRGMAFGNRYNTSLDRREPGRQRRDLLGGDVLEYRTDHAFDAAGRGAVKDGGVDQGAIVFEVLDIEPCRALNIDLDGRVLDRAVLSVYGCKVDL